MRTSPLATLSLSMCFAMACSSQEASGQGAKEGAGRGGGAGGGGSSGSSFQPKIETLLEGRDVVWSIEPLPDGRLLFTEKKGTMGILDPRTKAVSNVTGVPKVAVHGQGGLHDVRLSPDFATSKAVFLTYAKKVPDGYATALTRATLEGTSLTDVRELLVATPGSDRGEHFGSRIAFSADGKYVFASVGDRGKRENSQDLGVLPGKILRLTLDGKVPPDNPFVGRAGARPEIWSYGHRNTQGLQRKPGTDELWSHEHGPRGGDEINRIEKGRNYGWPIVTFGREYYGPKIGEGTTKPGIEAPLHQYTPSIAPSGLVIYDNDAIPAWKGKMLLGALVLTHLNVFDPAKKTEERYLAKEDERVREVRAGASGDVYLGTDSGKILRLTR